MSALLGNNFFENEGSLFRKKTTTDDSFRKTACVGETTFEPVVKKYFELKYKKESFGDNIYLRRIPFKVRAIRAKIIY